MPKVELHVGSFVPTFIMPLKKYWSSIPFDIRNILVCIQVMKTLIGTVSKKKKLMEFSIKGPDPPSQHP